MPLAPPLALVRRTPVRVPRGRSARSLLLVLAGLAACSSPPPPPPPPLPLLARDGERPLPRTPWTLPADVAADVAVDPSALEPFEVRVRVFRLGRLLDELHGELAPLARAVLLVTDPAGERALLPSLSLSALSFYGQGALAETWLTERPGLPCIDDRDVVVRPDRITRYTLEARRPAPLSSRPRASLGAPLTGLFLGVDLVPRASGVRVVLWAERPDDDPAHPRSREAVHLDLELSATGEPLLLLTRWDQFEGGADNLVLWLEPTPLREPLADEGRVRAEEARAAREALLRSIETGQRRTALLEAARLDASFTRDILLQGDEQLVEAYRKRLQHLEDLDSLLESDLALALGLERETLLLLVQRSQAGLQEPWEEGLLLRHCGVAAIYPDVIAGAARRARRKSDLVDAFEQENLFALGSSNPAERLRGLRWLEARGRTPTGYDPFATPGERFQVLRDHEQRRLDALAEEARAESARRDAEAAREGGPETVAPDSLDPAPAGGPDPAPAGAQDPPPADGGTGDDVEDGR